ncbi:MAG: glycosyl transferase [Chitinophagales bacterium]|nr:MAG: glycosyl transferase [Chitinophagales bacterium]
MKVLYISYDGMTDPLGQSQVLPYLEGLSDASVEIWLLSFEKKKRFAQNFSLIKTITGKAGIHWIPLTYTKSPPVLSTLWDVMRMQSTVRTLHKTHRFDVVHCRSYIAALAGLMLKRRYGVKFIFDMRGFWADERIDGKLWNLNNPVYASVYRYFKKKEKEFLEAADYTITLTYAARDIIHSWNFIRNNPVRIEVIPCCADLQLFNRMHIKQQQISTLRAELGIPEKAHIITYIGSLGTWYMLDEMMQFFLMYSQSFAEAFFVIVTQDDPSVAFAAAAASGVKTEKLRVVRAARREVPAWIALGEVSVFFVRQAFSKQGSSPTKQGEIMGMGVPIVCNSKIGDTEMVIKKYQAGWVIDAFTRSEYERVVREMKTQPWPDSSQIREGAESFYSLSEGIQRYRMVYQRLSEN